MIYHIITAQDWHAAQQAGTYQPDSLNSEGFIHFSTRDQVARVANAFYRGVPDLLLLMVDETALVAELRWEAPAPPNPDAAPVGPDAELFPHLYGPLNLDAVQQVLPYARGADGVFAAPPELG